MCSACARRCSWATHGRADDHRPRRPPPRAGAGRRAAQCRRRAPFDESILTASLRSPRKVAGHLLAAAVDAQGDPARLPAAELVAYLRVIAGALGRNVPAPRGSPGAARDHRFRGLLSAAGRHAPPPVADHRGTRREGRRRTLRQRARHGRAGRCDAVSGARRPPLLDAHRAAAGGGHDASAARRRARVGAAPHRRRRADRRRPRGLAGRHAAGRLAAAGSTPGTTTSAPSRAAMST